MLDDNERPAEDTPETEPMPPPAESDQPEPDLGATPAQPWLPEEDMFVDDGGDEPGPDDTGTLPPQPPRRRGSVIPLVLVGLLLLSLAGASYFAYNLYTQRDEIAQSTSDLLWMVKKQAPDEQSQRAIAEAITAIGSGEYQQIPELVSGITPQPASTGEPIGLPSLPGSQSPPQLTGPELEQALAELPEEARAYFKQHPDIFVKFLEQCTVSRQLRDQGKDVEALRAIRDTIIEAGAANDDAKVKDLLQKMGQLNRLTGSKEEILAALKPHIEKFQAAVQAAMKQGRDPRAAVEFMRKSEQAAAAGDLEKAKQYLEQGVKAAQKAPKGRQRPTMRRPIRIRRPGQRPGGAMGMMPSATLAQMLLQNVMGLMGAEDVDLTEAYAQIENAKIAIREKNGEQIKEILNGALERFENIGRRRAEFSRFTNSLLAERRDQARQRRQPDGEGRPDRPNRPDRPGADTDGSPRTRPGMRPGAMAMPAAARMAIIGGVMDIVARARSLSDEEFRTRADAIAQEIDQLLAPRRPEQPEVEEDEQPPTDIGGVRGYETEQEKAVAEERIRQKLQEAGEAYEELKQSGDDPGLVEELEPLFADARDALYDERYIEAEQILNEAMQKLGLDVEPLENLLPPADDDTGQEPMGDTDAAPEGVGAGE